MMLEELRRASDGRATGNGYRGAAPKRLCDLVDERATRDGARVALIEGSRRTSYAGLAEASRQAAAFLAAQQVRAGDRVLIVAENGIDAVVLLLAVQSLGAWPAVVSARLSAREIEPIRAACAGRLVVFVTGNSVAAEAHARLCSARAYDEAFGRGAIGLFDASAEAEPLPVDPGNGVGLLLFTSGTTGRPKAVMIAHRAMLAAGASMVRSRDLTAEDVIYGGAPVSHVMGGSTLLAAVFTTGACLRLMAGFSADELAGWISRGELTFLMAVPALHAKLVDHIAAARIDVSRHRLRCLVTGGAPLDAALARRIEATFGMPLGNAYGMTECAPILRVPPDVRAAGASVGFPESGIEVRLVANENDVEDGAVGEIWVRGPMLMLGYYRDPEATEAVMRPGGWFCTGDLARRLEGGDYAIVGRCKDLIIRSGFNVYPGEVEAAILEHPAVARCAVVGRAASDGDEEVIAFVELARCSQPNPQGILEAAGRRLAGYKRPSRIVVLEELPLVASGKVARARLRELATGLDAVEQRK